MKIDTFITYILVYLLTSVRINVLVPVKADGGQSSSSSQPAGAGSSSSPTHTATPETGVDLNVTSYSEATNNFDYNNDGEYVTCVAKADKSLQHIKEDKIEVWKETNVNNYSTKVEVECLTNDGKKVTIFLAGNKTLVHKKSGMYEPSSEIDQSDLNPISVNINDDNEIFFYSNKLLKHIRTFEAHTGFGFNVVTQTIGRRKVEIWKTNKPIEYAKIVEYARYYSGKLDVTVHSKHEKKYFIKEREDEGWKEYDISKVNPEPVNIQDRFHSSFYNYSFNNEVRSYTAKPGFSFNSVKHGDADIWTTANENEYAKKVVAKGEKKATIYIGEDGTRKVFIKGTYGNWVEDKTAATTLPDPSEAFAQPKVRLFKANHSDPANPLELGAGEYTSTQSGNVVSYQIANDVNCTHFMFDNVLLWAHDPNQRGGIYPKSVDHDTTTDTLVLRFDGLDITFAKNDQGVWVFTESGPLAVKFHLPDPNDSTKTVELASNQLTVSTNGDVTTFTIANGVNSIALTYGPVLLWKHDPDQFGGKHPKSLDYDKSTETLVLRFDGFYLTFAKNDQGLWEYTKTDTSAGEAAATTLPDPSEAFAQPKVRLFKANHSDPANPLELGAGEYTSTQSGNVVSYQIANDVNCTHFMFDNVLLWAHDPNQRGGIYPKSVDHDTTTDTLVLRFDGLDITFAKNDQGVWVFTESGPLAVKFHLPDPNDSTKTVELASNQLTVSTNGDVTTFTIANGVNSIALTYGPVLLWKHDPDQFGGKHPKSLDYDKSTETLVLRFDGFYLTFAKNDQGLWEYTKTDTSAGEAAATTLPDPSEAFAQPKVRLFKANHSDPANPLELGAGEYTSTQSGNVVSYQIANDVNCTHFMFDNVLLWAHDPNQRGGIYPKSVDHDTTTDTLVLRFDGLDITFAKNDQGVWVFTESGPLAVKFHLPDPNDSTKTVELASNQLTVSTNGDVTTFTIANGVNSIALTYGPVLLWKHDPDQFGGKHPKSLDYDKSTETLVLRFDGFYLTFAKNDQGLWEYTKTDTSAGEAAATTLPDPSEAFAQPKVRLFKANHSDPANPLELGAGEYTSTQSGNVVSYQIANDVNCTHFMFDNVLLWAHDPNQRGGIYPKSVDHDTTTDTLVLRFDGLDITFAKNDQGVWVFTESGPLAVKFHLPDPNDSTKTVELASNQLTVSTNGDVTTFTIANGVNSIALTYGPVLLWKHDPDQFGGKHPKSLDYDKSTETLVLRFDGFYLTFAKNDQGLWEYTKTDTSAGEAAATTLPDPSEAPTQPEDKFTIGHHLNELVEQPKDPEFESVSFNTIHGFPSGWHDNSDIVEVDSEPILNGLYPDTIRTGLAVDDLVHEERPVLVNGLYPDHVTTGSPSYDLQVEPDAKPILNGLYPDTFRTGSTVDELVREERPPLVNQQYPDLVTTGFPSYDLKVEPDPKPILNGLYPDTIRTGWARDDLDIQPQPHPILNGLYPDHLRTGWSINELDKSKKRKTVYTDFDPSIGFPSGWHDKSDIVEVDSEPILNGLYPDTIRTGLAVDDLVHEERPVLVNGLYPDHVTTGSPSYDLQVEPDAKPILNGLYPDTFRTGSTVDELVREERPPLVNQQYPDLVTTGFPSYDLKVEPDPKPILNGLYPDTIRTGWARDDLDIQPEPKPILNGLYPDHLRTGWSINELDKSKKRKTVYTDFDPSIGFPSGWHDNSDIVEVDSEPILNGLYPDTIRTGLAVDDLVHEERPVLVNGLYPDHVTTGSPSYDLQVEPDAKPILNGLYPDTFRTGLAVDDLVHEERPVLVNGLYPDHVTTGSPSYDLQVEPDAKPILNGLYPDTFRTGSTVDELVREERPPLVNQQYPDLVTTGFTSYDLKVEPDPKPILNGLYPDTIRTGWARDDLDIQPQPHPILNGLYPDHLRTGWSINELDKSKKRKTVYTDFDPSIGFPSGWHDNSDIVEVDSEPILNGLYPDTIRTGLAVDDLVHEERPVLVNGLYPDHVTTGSPSYDLQVEPDAKPILNGLYPDTFRTGSTVDELVREERPPLVNQQYPDLVTTGFPSYDLKVEPDPKPILNGLYPDTIRTGWARDDLDIQPQPHPILNGLYPDHLRTGWSINELDKSKKRKTVYTDFDPSIGFPSGWHDNSDIVEVDSEPILNGLYPDTIRTGLAVDDLVHEERPVLVNGLYPDHVTTGSPSYDLQVEPDAKPILNGLYPDTFRTGSTVDELVREERPPLVNQQYPDLVTTGFTSYDLKVEPDPKPILNGLYPDTIRTGWARDDLDIQPQPHPILNGLYPDHLRTGWSINELDKSKKRKTVYTDFDPSIGFPSGWHDNSDIVEVDSEPILNGLYPDTIRTGLAVDDLVHEERPVLVNGLYPDHVTTGSPSYDLQVEPDAKPILNGLYPDTFRTGSTVDELVREERPPLVNQQYPDLVTTGFPSYDLKVEPDPKPILNGLYPDTIRTGWARDDLDIQPEPKPILNGLYPDHLRTGWSINELDKSKKRKTVYTDFDPSIGFPSGWHDNSDIVYVPELDHETDFVSFYSIEGFPTRLHITEVVEKPQSPFIGPYPDASTTFSPIEDFDFDQEPKSINDLEPEDVSFDSKEGFPTGLYITENVERPKPILNGLYPDTIRTGWARDDLDVDQYVTFVNILPEMNLGNKDLVFDFSVITLATEDTPYKIIQGDDEMLIKKHKIDEVFNKYSCSLTNERSFRPQIRYLLSNFQLDVDDVSEFELYAGEFDEPLLIRMKNPSGWTTYIRKSYYKWEVGNVSHLDINVLDKHYLNLRDDITMIDCSKKSGHYVFGKYKVVVTDPDPKDVGQLAGYKTYVHTIYYNTSSIEFTSAKVHRFKYGTTSLDGFMRYWMSKVYVHFWEHELTKPIYIRAFADHGIANYFGYPNYTMQTDVSMFPYFLKRTNFEVNNALVINLARHQKYDFEGGVSPHLTLNQVTVKVFENSPLSSFRRNVHTLTVRDVNKPFRIIRVLYESSLKVDPTIVSSLEAYYHNNHLKKPLLVITNGSSRQSFFKLESDNYVKMDNLIINLKNTLKYLAYHNYKYVTLDVTKTTAYYYTGAQNSPIPDCNLIVSVNKEDLSEFSKYTHSIKIEDQQSKFKLIALDGVKINIDDSELTSVDCYFFNEHNDIPLAVVLRGTTDLIYAIKKSHPIKKDSTFLTSLNDNLRNLVQFNFGLLYLRLDKTANYYNNQDYGFEIEVVQDELLEGNYTKYVHKFPEFTDISFVVGDDFYHTKIDPQGKFKTAIVYINKSGFPEIVTLIDDKQEPRHFIYQDNKYKRAKKESVDRKLGLTGSQVQTEGNDQS